MNPESIPKLRVIDNGSQRAAPKPEPAPLAAGETGAPAGAIGWRTGLIFLMGAMVGGGGVPLLAEYLW